jgi:hypothetical protein
MTDFPKQKPGRKKNAPPEAHLQLEPIAPDRRDVTEYARKKLPSGESVTKMQFQFIEKFFELEYDGPKAVVMAGFQTKDPARKSSVLLAIPAIAEEIIRRMAMKRRQFDLELSDIEQEMWDQARDHGEDSSHAARISGLAHLMRARGAFEKQGDKTKKVPVAVNIDMGEILGDEEKL